MEMFAPLVNVEHKEGLDAGIDNASAKYLSAKYLFVSGLVGWRVLKIKYECLKRDLIFAAGLRRRDVRIEHTY